MVADLWPNGVSWPVPDIGRYCPDKPRHRRSSVAKANHMDDPMTSSDTRLAASGLQHEFAQAYQYAPIGLCTLDRDLRYVHINEWLAQLNGHSVEEHLGRTLSEILPNVAEQVASQLRRVFETGNPMIKGTAYAETAAHPGEKRLYEHNYHAIRSAGTTRGLVVLSKTSPREQQ